MQLSKSEDIEAPRDAVFRILSDVDHWERTALRRGVDVQRIEGKAGVALGSGWKVGFPFRGKRRDLTLQIDRVETGHELGVTARGKALEAKTRIVLTEMSPRRTRLTVTVDVSALTLAARLFLQSLRLAQGRVRFKFDKGIAQLAQEIEARLKHARG